MAKSRGMMATGWLDPGMQENGKRLGYCMQSFTAYTTHMYPVHPRLLNRALWHELHPPREKGLSSFAQRWVSLAEI